MPQTASAADRFSRLAASGHMFVLAAIAVISVGLGTGFYVQLSVPLWAALAGSVLAFVCLLNLHVSVMRGGEIAVLKAQIASMEAALGVAGGSRAGTQLARTAVRVKADPVRIPSEPAPNAPGREADRRDTRGLGVSHALQAAPVPEETGELTLAQQTAMARALAEAEPDEPEVAADPSATARQHDAATIQEFVKKLASETGPNPAPARSPVQRAAEAGEPTAQTAPPAARPTAAVDAEITESVRALRATAEVMRPSAARRGAPGASRKPEGEPPSLSTSSQDTPATAAPRSGQEQPAQDIEVRAAALAEALSAERIDVLLEPILGLKDHAPRHYEVFVRWKSPDGQFLDRDDDNDVLAGSGLLPLLDLAKLPRIAEVIRRLSDRGKSGSVFAALAGESFGDDDFLNRFAEISREQSQIKEQLVVSLAQSDARAFSPEQLAIFRELGTVGFRFALDHVTDLDMDFDALRGAGIQYVKLDANVYLDGLAAADGVVIPASDIYRFLVEKSLSLIVGDITSENQLMRIVDCGALFGQGRLFGAPRSIKAQVFAKPAA